MALDVFSKIEAPWQPRATSTAESSAKYYKGGNRKQAARRVDIGPGGTGAVIAKTSESSLTRKGD